jgi:hypothetical protein
MTTRLRWARDLKKSADRSGGRRRNRPPGPPLPPGRRAVPRRGLASSVSFDLDPPEADCKGDGGPTRDVHVSSPAERTRPSQVQAIVDRETGSVLMLIDDEGEAEAIMNELRRSGVQADIVTMAGNGRHLTPEAQGQR